MRRKRSDCSPSYFCHPCNAYLGDYALHTLGIACRHDTTAPAYFPGKKAAAAEFLIKINGTINRGGEGGGKKKKLPRDITNPKRRRNKLASRRQHAHCCRCGTETETNRVEKKRHSSSPFPGLLNLIKGKGRERDKKRQSALFFPPAST